MERFSNMSMKALEDFMEHMRLINDTYSKDETGNEHVYELDLSDMEWVCACGAMKFAGNRRNERCKIHGHRNTTES